MKTFTAGNSEPSDFQQGRDLETLRTFVQDNLEKLCQVRKKKKVFCCLLLSLSVSLMSKEINDGKKKISGYHHAVSAPFQRWRFMSHIHLFSFSSPSLFPLSFFSHSPLPFLLFFFFFFFFFFRLTTPLIAPRRKSSSSMP